MLTYKGKTHKELTPQERQEALKLARGMVFDFKVTPDILRYVARKWIRYYGNEEENIK